MISAMDETYEVTKLDWIEVLFTNSRIDRRTVPEGLHCYDLRHDDDWTGIVCEVAPKILVNHWGTIITRTEIPMTDGNYFPKDPDECVELFG